MSYSTPSTPSGPVLFRARHNSVMEVSSAPSTKHHSNHEPSPASTHGESVVDSVLNTPWGKLTSGTASFSPQSLRIVSTPAGQSIDLESPVQNRRLGTSMVHVEPRKQYDRALPIHDRGNLSVFQSTNSGSSPARLAEMLENLSVQKDLAKEALSRLPGTPSKPNPTGGSFVKGATHDDPFTASPTRTESCQSTLSTSLGTPTRRIKSASATPSRNSSRLQSPNLTPGSHSKGKINGLASIEETTFSPRPDHVGEQPTSDNAQAIFPPNACIFVANLTSACSDELLERAITANFSTYGTVYVKIRRDSRGMPYAFCQYETKIEADHAVVAGKNKLIHGRPCRTEIAKAQRALYVSRHNGKAVTEQEIRTLLSARGDLEKVFIPTDTEREIYQLPLGMWVRFAFFQDCRDAILALRGSTEFRFDQVQEPIRKPQSRQLLNTSKELLPCISQTSAQQSTPIVNDECVIVVENLPFSISHRELSAIFERYGHIQAVHITSQKNLNGSPVIFADIVYRNLRSVLSATKAENGRMLGSFRIRVEQKKTESLFRRPLSSTATADATKQSAHSGYSLSQMTGHVASSMRHTSSFDSPTTSHVFSGGRSNTKQDPNATPLNATYLYPPFHQYYHSAWPTFADYNGMLAAARNWYVGAPEIQDGAQPFAFRQMQYAAGPYGYYNYQHREMTPTAENFQPTTGLAGGQSLATELSAPYPSYPSLNAANQIRPASIHTVPVADQTGATRFSGHQSFGV